MMTPLLFALVARAGVLFPTRGLYLLLPANAADPGLAGRGRTIRDILDLKVVTAERKGSLACPPCCRLAVHFALGKSWSCAMFIGRELIMVPPNDVLPPPLDEIGSRLAPFCQRHGIARLEVFGSLARGESHPGSDIDLLVTFQTRRTPRVGFL